MSNYSFTVYFGNPMLFLSSFNVATFISQMMQSQYRQKPSKKGV